jgi:hypothetical protein
VLVNPNIRITIEHMRGGPESDMVFRGPWSDSRGVPVPRLPKHPSKPVPFGKGRKPLPNWPIGKKATLPYKPKPGQKPPIQKL